MQLILSHSKTRDRIFNVIKIRKLIEINSRFTLEESRYLNSFLNQNEVFVKDFLIYKI